MCLQPLSSNSWMIVDYVVIHRPLGFAFYQYPNCFWTTPLCILPIPSRPTLYCSPLTPPLISTYLRHIWYDERTAVFVRLGDGQGWVDNICPRVNPRYRVHLLCHVHRPDDLYIWCDCPILGNHPTSCRVHWLCAHSASNTTRPSRNSDSLRRSCASESACWPCTPNCIVKGSGCNPLWPGRKGVSGNLSSRGRTFHLNENEFRSLVHLISLGTHRLPGNPDWRSRGTYPWPLSGVPCPGSSPPLSSAVSIPTPHRYPI